MRGVVSSTYRSFSRFAVLTLFAIAVLAIGQRPARAQVCTGDCNGNDVVAIDELITCVNIALDRGSLSACPACDGESAIGLGAGSTLRDGTVQVDDLVRAVQNSINRNALGECVPPPTATNTPTHTATNTPVEPTATPTPTNTSPPTATNTPTNTPEPTATDTPEPTETNTPEPTATDTPEPTETNTPEPTATDTPVAICGNGQVDPGEQCDDGNTLEGFGDDCPADCHIAPCTQGATTVTAQIVFTTDPADLLVHTLALFVRYPDGAVDVPGTDSDAAVMASVSSDNFDVIPDDRDFAIDLLLTAIGAPGGTAGATAGTAASIVFHLCAGGPLPNPDDFRCEVASAMDPDAGNVTELVSCSVVLGALPPTPTPTNTPEATSTDTPEPTATATNTPEDTPTPTITNTSAATNTPTPTNTPTSTPTDTPQSTSTPTHTPSSTPTGTPTATNTPAIPCPLEAGSYTQTQTAGGTLKVSGLAPFPFPAGGTIKQDVGAGTQPACVHNTVVPFPGGFSAPVFCIPALVFTVGIQQTGCGVGQIDSNGGSDYKVTESGDTSDASATCSLPHAGCANGADADIRVDVTVGGGSATCGSGTANAIVSVPVQTTTWQDVVFQCPDADGAYNPGTDALITSFPQFLDFTTDNTSADFVDLDGNGCCIAGSGPATHLNPCNIGGAGGPSGTGTCIDLAGVDVAGADVTTVATGAVGSNGFPLYDLTFISTLPNAVTTTGPNSGATCPGYPITIPGTSTRCIDAP